MSRTRERCPRCTSKLVISRFDTAFRLDDASERLCFGIPGSLCQGCVQLFVDPDLLDLLDLEKAVCTFAIESDLVLQEQAWSAGRQARTLRISAARPRAAPPGPPARA